MALSGYFYGTTDNPRVKPKITWAATQDTEENYSDITVELSYSRTNTGYTTSGTWEGEITIGDQVFTGRHYVKVEHESNTLAMTATARVYHDAYGNLTVPISASGGIDGSSVTQTLISGQAEMDTIARAGTVSAANAPIGSRATIVVVRKNDGFTHSLSYRFGTLEGFIDREGNPVAEEQKMTAAAVNFLLPESFYYEIPDSQSALCQIICRTYAGEAFIGESQCQFTASADPNICAPQVTRFHLWDSNPHTAALTGNTNVLVRYASTACCVASAEGKFGARILSVSVNGVHLLDGQRAFPKADTEEYVLTVIDSRGFQTRAVKQLPLIPYVELTCMADAQRTDPTADTALLTLQGSCWSGNFGAVDNSLTVTCAVAGGTPQTITPQIGENHTYAAQLTVFGVSYTQNYPVVLTLSDGAQTITKELTIRKGVPVFHWGEHEFHFHVPVVLSELFVGQQSLEEYIRTIVQGENE